MRSHPNNQLLIDKLTSIANRLDEERLSKFVSIAIEANENHLALMSKAMSPDENAEHQLILNQGVYLSLFLANLRGQ